MTYAYTRSLDAGTGETRINGNRWVAGSPALEIVVRVLRTPRGRYLPDPEFGVDYDVLQKATANVAAAWKAEVERALKYLVDARRIRDLVVTVDPPTAAGALLFEVSFRDVRLDQRLTTGRLRA